MSFSLNLLCVDTITFFLLFLLTVKVLLILYCAGPTAAVVDFSEGILEAGPEWRGTTDFACHLRLTS